MMSEEFGITRESSEMLGFVMTSLFCSAINLEELHEWCYKIIEKNNVGDVPSYIFDLSEYRDGLAKIFKTIGFVPTWEHDKVDEAALCGIAMRRGVERFEWPVGRDEAINALGLRPEIEKRYKLTFPFIS